MKKKIEEYKYDLLKPIHKGLQNGMSVKHLAKKFSIPKQMVLEIKDTYRKIIDKEKKLCHKKYTTYKAQIKKKKGTPYASKLGGIPYIPEGEEWITCSKCKKEKVLILQLNINELPDISSELREWDFIQVYACMKPSKVLLKDEDRYEDYRTSQYKGEENEDEYLSEFFYKRIEANRCYNMVERDSHYDYVFDEKIDGKNMNPLEPFNLYFDIQLLKQGKPAKSFTYPPWIDGYNLFVNEQDKKVESNIYNDQRSYVWAEQHCFGEKIITEWEKLREVACTFHFEDLNMCSGSENSDSDLLGLLNGYWIEEQSLAHLASQKVSELKHEELTMDEWIEQERKVQQIMNCPCCEKPLTLLFQFALSDEKELILKSERDSWNNNVYALFYCEDEPEVMSCQWVGYED